MNDLDRIKDQFHRTYAGPAWHGPSLLAVLSDLVFPEPQFRLIPGVHTIGELVRHLIAWRTLILNRLRGDHDYKVHDEEDWTYGPGNQEEWLEDLEQLRANERELMLLLGRFNPKTMDDQVPGSDVTWYTLFHGLIQHDLYHLGQISLLKKAMRG